MQTAKQEAISRLPDTADIEEIMYRLYVLENIRHGQEDAPRNFLATILFIMVSLGPFMLA